jgi:hypothetical protein
VSVLYCYIWAILNLKSTPKMTPNSTPKKTPDSTPCFTACHKYMLDFKVVFEVLSCDKSLFFHACVIWEVLWMVFDLSVWIFCFLQQNKMKLLECQPTKAKDLFHMILLWQNLEKDVVIVPFSPLAISFRQNVDTKCDFSSCMKYMTYTIILQVYE